MIWKRVLRQFLLPFCLFQFGWPAVASAGGGPENLLLVVNPRSQASLHIANYYAKLRQIPPDNLLYIPFDPSVGTTDVNTFRDQILSPILRFIEARRLGSQIDAIVYSSDFPWRVDFNADIPKFLADPNGVKYLEDLRRLVQMPGEKPPPKPDEKQPAGKVEWSRLLGSAASINGLTYLWQAVMNRSFEYATLQSNCYMRLAIAEQRDAQTVGFRGNRVYDRVGKVVATHGRRYFLSMMLGVTAGRGNSLGEIFTYLRRSAEADDNHPKGTIYFVRNSDVRSTVRDKQFPAAVGELKKLGVAAEILEGTVPKEKFDVQGLMMGTASFDWRTSGSIIRPGAICEHFTSFGGIMTADAGQTPLSEFLRYGAAAASGSVAEPYSIPHKFPAPMMQVHYARGCTLAEAFYQSVWGPYQLLIVGDPLCQPWADIPQVSATGVDAGATVNGSITLEPAAALSTDAEVTRFELFADGVRMAECKPDKRLTLDTTPFADGWHELRVVAIGPPPIESQGRRIIPVRLANHGRKITATLLGDGPWRSDKPLMIAVDSPGSVAVVAMHGRRAVGRIVGEKGRIDIPAGTLGAGPVRIRVVALGKGGASTNVVADPIDVTLQ